MPHDWTFKILIPVMLAAIALFMLSIGLRGLLTRRPFLLSARWLLLLVLLAFLPQR